MAVSLDRDQLHASLDQVVNAEERQGAAKNEIERLLTAELRAVRMQGVAKLLASLDCCDVVGDPRHCAQRTQRTRGSYISSEHPAAAGWHQLGNLTVSNLDQSTSLTVWGRYL